MNIKNFEFLRDGLKYMGFGETLNNDLEAKIKEQPKDFVLNFQGEFKNGSGTDRVDYNLQFRKSNENDMYFFNRYEAVLKNEDPSKSLAQTFFVNKNSGVTAKEAYNMLKGRAVYKKLTTREDQPFTAWLQLDFSKKDDHGNHMVNSYHSGYGYKLDEVLKRYPIKELGNEDDKKKVVASLEKGNVQAVTFQTEGKDERMFVEANPKYKTLNLYSSKMEKVFQGAERNQKTEKAKSVATPASEAPAVSKEESKGQGDEDGKKAKRPRIST